MRRKSRIFLFTVVAPLILLFAFLSVTAVLGSSDTQSKQFAAATCYSLTTDVAMDILAKGGNAFDAAVAAGFASAVVEPSSTGLGGGGFATIYIAGQDKVLFIDFREVAPLASTRDMYASDESMAKRESLIGAKAAGVPGFVAGMEVLHSQYGSMKWSELLEPAIKFAEDGFPMYGSLGRKIDRAKRIFETFPETQAIFLVNGDAPKEGSIFKQPVIAQTLKQIKSKGAKSFYRGKTAEKLVATMQKYGGIITLADMAGYKPEIRTPIKFRYKGGYEIYSAPPPSSGGIVLAEIMNILEPLDVRSLKHGSVNDIHVLAEAMKHAFKDRAKYMGDPDFVDIPVERLVSKSYATLLRQLIELDRTQPATEIEHESIGPKERVETSHISIIDSHGNAVSMTITINGPFGSGLVVGGAGFFLNNEMDDFSKKPGEPNLYGLVGFEANAVKPGKRPLSSMSPTIVFKDGKLKGALGAPGGPMIITSVFQTLFNLMERDFGPDKAVQSGRIHHQWLPDTIKVEPELVDTRTAMRLVLKGHHVMILQKPNIGNVQLVWKAADGKLQAVSDYRWDGKALVKPTQTLMEKERER